MKIDRSKSKYACKFVADSEVWEAMGVIAAEK